MSGEFKAAWMAMMMVKLGMDEEGVRQFMADSAKKQTNTKTNGLASMTPEKRKEISLKGVEARRKAKDEKADA